MPAHEQASRPRRLARQEWALVALGLVVWLALAFAGMWFFHQMTRSKAACGGQIEARSLQPKAAPAGPRNALQLLTGTGRCP